MRNKVFITRACNLLLVLGILLAYQLVLWNRDQTEQITSLQSEKETLTAQVEVYEQEILKAAASQKAEAEKAVADSGAIGGTEQSGYQDGIYSGSAQGFGGPIQVEVTVESGELTDIEVVSAEQEDSAFLGMAEAVIDDMLYDQSTEVDTVSGATYSSTGIINAVISALEQAVTE